MERYLDRWVRVGDAPRRLPSLCRLEAARSWLVGPGSLLEAAVQHPLSSPALLPPSREDLWCLAPPGGSKSPPGQAP